MSKQADAIARTSRQTHARVLGTLARARGGRDRGIRCPRTNVAPSLDTTRHPLALHRASLRRASTPDLAGSEARRYMAPASGYHSGSITSFLSASIRDNLLLEVNVKSLPYNDNPLTCDLMAAPKGKGDDRSENGPTHHGLRIMLEISLRQRQMEPFAAAHLIWFPTVILLVPGPA